MNSAARRGRDLGQQRRRREGDWVCSTHDVVTPCAETIVPSCPHCGALVLHAVRERGRDYLVYVEPRPQRCDNDHRLAPGRTLVGWYVCQCPPVLAAGDNGHRT